MFGHNHGNQNRAQLDNSQTHNKPKTRNEICIILLLFGELNFYPVKVLFKPILYVHLNIYN